MVQRRVGFNTQITRCSSFKGQKVTRSFTDDRLTEEINT